MKKLYFVRHGESTVNANGIWGARAPAPLTELGRDQARAEGKRAKELGLKFDIIISSPTRRARETAEIIAEEIGYLIKDIVNNDLFMERSVGVLEGGTFEDFFKAHAYEDLDAVEGAETIEDLQKRAAKAHEHLLKLPQARILVVSHSAFGRALRRVINSQPHTEEYIEHTSLPHAEILCWVEEE